VSSLPKVDFYVLGAGGAGARARFACRLLEKVVDRGHRVFVRTASASGARDLDELMWTYSDRSFLPHEILALGTTPSPRTPVLIGDGVAPPGHRDLLVNLSGGVPQDLEEYARIAEIVAADDEDRRLARERFRQYRDRGCTLDTHNL
jgi:DNA polymerase III subunit chi